MEEKIIHATKRSITGKQTGAMRRNGELPAVIYGRHITPISIVLNYRDASKLLSGITSSHLVTLDLDGEKRITLVRDKQRHPVSGSIIHVDFLAVTMTEKLKASVLLELQGESPAVEIYNGVLVTGQEEIEVESLPQYLPERIYVDISNLKNIGDSICVKDLMLSENINVLTDKNEMVVLVTSPAVEEELITEKTFEEPELIERARKEELGE